MCVCTCVCRDRIICGKFTKLTGGLGLQPHLQPRTHLKLNTFHGLLKELGRFSRSVWLLKQKFIPWGGLRQARLLELTQTAWRLSLAQCLYSAQPIVRKTICSSIQIVWKSMRREERAMEHAWPSPIGAGVLGLSLSSSTY